MALNALQERYLDVSTTDHKDTQLQVSGSPHQSTVEVSGGSFSVANFGPQNHHVKVTEKKYIEQDLTSAQIGVVNITHVHQSLLKAADASPPRSDQGETDWIDLKGSIRMYHNRTLGGRHNIYHGERHRDITGVTPLAIKSLPLTEHNIREANMLLHLKHPNVVTVEESDSYFLGPVKHMFIAMERCQDRNLYDHVLEQKSSNVPFDRENCISQAKQLAEGLGYIHDSKIIHRDLKPHNILLSLCGKFLKICDFGLSKTLTSGRSTTVSSMSRIGTDGYRAPETYRNGEISQEADVFSYGLIAYFLLSYGLHPFGEDPDEWNINIKRYQGLCLDGLKVEDTEGAKILLKKMLQLHPKDRPTAVWILQDAIFTGKRHRPDTLHPSLSTPQLKSPRPPQNPMKHNSGAPFHTSESDSALLVLEHNKTMFQLIDLDDGSEQIGVTEADHHDIDCQSEFFTGSSTENLPQAIALAPPPENPRRRRNRTFLEQALSTIGQRNSVSAENSPRISRCFETGGAWKMSQRATVRERSKPVIPEVANSRRPRSLLLPNETHHLQDPLLPHMLYAARNEMENLRNGLFVFDEPSKATHLYNPQKKEWSRRHTVFPEISKQHFSALALGEFVYVLTGAGHVFRVNYSGQNAAWERMPNMRKYHGDRPPAVALNGKIYVVGVNGGDSLHPTDEVEEFTPSLRQWTDVAKMDSKKQNHAVATAEGCIYCIGGQGKSMLDTVDKLDPSTGRWMMVPSMKRTRANPAAVTFDAKIYVLGGFRACRLPAYQICDCKLSVAEVFDVKTEVWSTLAQMQKPRAIFSACLVNGQIYAVGGSKKGFQEEKKTIESYDIQSRKWTLTQVPKDIKMDSASAVSIRMPWSPTM